MRCTLLLFTLIVSSILAVSPTPVPAGSQHPDATVSTAGLASDTVIIAFINREGESLGDYKTKFPEQDNNMAIEIGLTTTFYNHGFNTRNIIYKGSYVPERPSDRRWRYYIAKGGKKCSPNPCHGWIARGLAVWKRAENINGLQKGGIDGRVYLGVSLGEPKPTDQFEAIMGRPDQQPDYEETPIMQVIQGEWDQLSEEFQKHFMKDALPPAPPAPSVRQKSSKPRPPRPPVTVTFIDQGHNPRDQDLTHHINGALRRNRKALITYVNAYSLQPKILFKLNGGERCAKIECFGLITQPEPTTEAGKKAGEIHILIVQRRPDGLYMIGAYPLMDANEKHEMETRLAKIYDQRKHPK